MVRFVLRHPLSYCFNPTRSTANPNTGKSIFGFAIRPTRRSNRTTECRSGYQTYPYRQLSPMHRYVHQSNFLLQSAQTLKPFLP